MTAGRRLAAPQPLPAPRAATPRAATLRASALRSRADGALTRGWSGLAAHAHAGGAVAARVLLAAVGVVAAAGVVRVLARRPEWRWPVDGSQRAYRRLAALDPGRDFPDGRVSARWGVALVVLFAVAFTAHLTLVAGRTPTVGMIRPRRLAVASALVVALPFAGLTGLGLPALAWLGRWALLADAAALVIALGVTAAGGIRLTRWAVVTRPATLVLALGALAAVPLLQTTSYADGAPITVVAQVEVGDERLHAMTEALSRSVDVQRVEVRRRPADPSWAVVTVHAKAGADSADARALVRYLRGDSLRSDRVRGASLRRDAPRFDRLVTGSAAGDVEAGQVRAELPWIAGWLALAVAALGALSRRRRMLTVTRAVAADDVPVQRTAPSDTLVADEPS